MPPDTEPSTPGTAALSLLFEPVGSWWFVLLVAAGLTAVLLLVKPDRSRVNTRQMRCLVALRLAAFVTLVVCMLRPTVVAQRQLQQEGDLLVLVDASESMTVADAPAGQTRWEHLVASLEAAEPAARELLDAGNVRLRLWQFDRSLESVPGTSEKPFPLQRRWQKQESSEETAIGSALDEAVQTTSFDTLAGVILLSDGAQHAYPPRDLPPQTVARRLGDSGIPLWSVLFGQQRSGSQGRDAEVVQISVPEDVFVKTTVQVEGRVRLSGLADREVVVRLMVENAEGVLEEASRTVVRGGGAAVEEVVRLNWSPDEAGERKVALEIEPLEGETVITNNQVSSFVNVIDGGLQVLYVEGALRVEQRFLRRTLSASPDIQIDFRWIDASKREDWPVDISELLTDEIDVFLIGDLDADALSAEQLAVLNDRVGQGAGLGLLGGLHAFEAGGWASTPLQPALPFEQDPLARQPFGQPIRESLHLRGPLKMLPDPRFGGNPILRLADTPAENLEAWQQLPPLEGANVLGQLGPAAQPLAISEAGDPLLVAKNYGTGRVAALAVDSTWRWVMQGADRPHRRFWRQFIFWLASRDDIGDDALWVRPAQRRISIGAPLAIDAGLRRADGEPILEGELEAEVVAPDGTKRPLRLVREGDSWAGQLTDCGLPGDWTVSVAASREGQQFARRDARFTVFRQDLELANPVANGLVMRELAEETGQQMQPAEEIGLIFEELLERPVVYASEAEWSLSLWDSWPMLLLAVTFMSAEWFFRKRWGLA
jgi:hypothetical protein